MTVDLVDLVDLAGWRLGEEVILFAAGRRRWRTPERIQSESGCRRLFEFRVAWATVSDGSKLELLTGWRTIKAHRVS